MDMVGAALISQEMEAGQGIETDNRDMLKPIGADGDMMNTGGAQAPTAGTMAMGGAAAEAGGSDTAVNPTGAKVASNDDGCDCDANRGGPASLLWLSLLIPMFFRKKRRA